jgi:hypothetical protein
MPEFLLLKHYRGAPAPVNDSPFFELTDDEKAAHIAYMDAFAERLEATGEFVDGRGWRPEVVWVRAGDHGLPPVVERTIDDRKDIIAGWMIINVANWERAIELAGELSAAPGRGGLPVGEWLEVREG